MPEKEANESELIVGPVKFPTNPVKAEPSEAKRELTNIKRSVVEAVVENVRKNTVKLKEDTIKGNVSTESKKIQALSLDDKIRDKKEELNYAEAKEAVIKERERENEKFNLPVPGSELVFTPGAGESAPLEEGEIIVPKPKQ